MSLFDVGKKKPAASSTAPVRLDAAMMERIDKYYRSGVKRLPDAENWYADTFFNLQNILTVYDDEGRPERNDSDQRAYLFIDLLAATSPQTNIRRNTFLTTQIFQFITDGVLCKIRMDFEAHLNNVCRALLNLSLSGQKVSAFRANLLGDSEAVTIDTWMMRVFDKDHINPTAAEYDDLSRATRKVARDYGVSPSQMQAALWVGIKALEGDDSDTPEPFEKTLERFKAHQDAQGSFNFQASESKFQSDEQKIASANRSIAANPPESFRSQRIIGPRMREVCEKEAHVTGALVDAVCDTPPELLMDAILFVRKNITRWERGRGRPVFELEEHLGTF